MPARGLIQREFVAVAVNTTTTSAVFVTLLSRPITVLVTGSDVDIIATFAVSHTSAADQTTFFRITFDGVPVRGAGLFSTDVGETNSGAIIAHMTGVAAGVHTVLLEWRTTAATAQIRPVAAPDAESAALFVDEVAV